VDALITAAKSKLGAPYVWSEEGPDCFDCSGLVYFSLRSAGMSVGRYSASGYSQVSSWQSVSFSELQTGDLIFFRSDSKESISHTGIWLGGNKYIHASSSAGKVVISSWSDWANRNFVLGKRVW
jgi:cell wall-associated NlpC family hydrolase